MTRIALNMQNFLNMALVMSMTMTLSCGVSPETPQSSESKGSFKGIEQFIILPKLKTPETLRSVKTLLGKQMAKLGITQPTATNQATLGRAFNAAYIEAVHHAGGLPRSQGEAIVKELVSPESQACGGTSCAVIFGVSPNDVSEYFNGMLTVAGSSKALAKPENTTARRVILGSLVPETKGTVSSSWEVLTPIFLTQPHRLPLKTRPKEQLPGKWDATFKAGIKFTDAVHGYTFADYRSINLIETTPPSDLTKLPISAKEIKKWADRARLINEGLKKMPIFKGTIYRGITDVKIATLAQWVSNWREQRLVGLGRNNKASLISCTWDIDVADIFVNPIGRILQSHLFSVLFVIKEHRGVSVENISKYTNEREILLPSDQKFLIDHMAPLENGNRTMIIYLRGVDAGADEISQAPKKAA